MEEREGAWPQAWVLTLLNWVLEDSWFIWEEAPPHPAPYPILGWGAPEALRAAHGMCISAPLPKAPPGLPTSGRFHPLKAWSPQAPCPESGPPRHAARSVRSHRDRSPGPSTSRWPHGQRWGVGSHGSLEELRRKVRNFRNFVLTLTGHMSGHFCDHSENGGNKWCERWECRSQTWAWTPGYGKTSYALRSSRNRIRQPRVGGSRSLSEMIQTSGPDLGEDRVDSKNLESGGQWRRHGAEKKVREWSTKT